jgi:hypothetical protein
MSTFKVGDRVYHVVEGLGTVVAVSADGFTVQLESRPRSGSYYSDGRYSRNDVNPSVITLEEAHAKGYGVPRPKRKVRFAPALLRDSYGFEYLSVPYSQEDHPTKVWGAQVVRWPASEALWVEIEVEE